METIDTAGPRISDPHRELDATAHPLPQHNQLMSECPPQHRFSGVVLVSLLAYLYSLRVTTAAIAALQSSPSFVRASLTQATFWMRRRTVPHCPSTSVRHVFPAAATSASLALHTSERSVRCSLTQAAIRLLPGWMLAQAFFISASQAPNRDCANAPETSRNDKAAQIDKIFSI